MKVLVIATERANKLRQPLISAGCNVSVISPETETSPQRRYVTFLLSIYTEIKRGQYDVIITRGAGFVGSCAIIIGRSHQIPVVTRIAGDKFTAYWEGLCREISDTSIQGFLHIVIRSIMFLFCMVTASRVIVVSDHLRDRYEVFTKLAHQTFVVVPVSIDLPSDRSVKEPNDIDGQTLLTVTNLNFKGKYNGVKKSMTAVFEILNERSDVKYVIAGDGRYHEDLNEYIDANSPNEDVRERIHMPGYVEPIASLFRQADVFVYFSFQDGYPNVILEAMSYGLPIITNDAEGMAEQIISNRSGIFADVDDPNDIRSKIATLINEPEKRAKLGSRAQAQVEVANSHESVGKQYVQELESLI